MILFLTGQYAGAQYIHPLLKKWKNSGEGHTEYKLVATGSSVKYWQNNSQMFDEISHKNTSSVKEYLIAVKPKLIILSASGTEELEYLFILEAKRLVIKTANFIDTWTNYKNRYIYNGKKVYPDIVLSIDEKCTEEMVEEGIPTELIQEIGQPYLEEICENIPPLGEKILLPLQPIRKSRGDSLGYDEEDFLKLTLAALKQAGKVSESYFTSHPDSNLDMFNKESLEVKQGEGIDEIKNSHTVLGMFSMQMVVAYLWGRKVASVQPGLTSRDPSPLSRWGLIPRIQNSKQLELFIEKPNSKRTSRSKIISSITGSLDRFERFCMQELHQQ